MKKKMLFLGLVLIGQGQAKGELSPVLEKELNNKLNYERFYEENNQPPTFAKRLPAQLDSELNFAMDSIVTRIIVNKIMNNEPIPERYAVSSLQELNKIRDELFLKNAGSNEFLRTPIKVSEDQDNKILKLLKAYKKRYHKNHKEYVDKVIAIMKYPPQNNILLRPLFFQKSGLQMSDLAEAGINFTTYRLSIKDRALFKRTRRNIFNALTQDYDNLRNRLPKGY